MTNGGNGGRISDKGWISIGLAITLATFVAFAAGDRAATKKDIEHLEEGVTRLTDERDTLRDKLSDYRAQVDTYRSEDFRQKAEIQALVNRVTILEGPAK